MLLQRSNLDKALRHVTFTLADQSVRIHARGSLLLGSACFVSTALTRGTGSIQELRHFFVGSRYLTELTLQCEVLELYGSSHLAFPPIKTAHF